MLQERKLSRMVLCLLLVVGSDALGGDLRYGIGFRTGLSRLEGDLRNPKLSPLVSRHLRVLPTPYLAVNGELGFSPLLTSSGPTQVYKGFKTSIVPFELDLIFNFLPFGRVNPYVIAGGGGVYWSASADNDSGTNSTIQDGLDSFLKTGGGLEFRLARNLGPSVGASFRLSFTDAFDQLWQGDENDQVLDVHTGLTYYFGSRGNDKDHDLIPDELDLMPEIAEDRDGYLDHDGIPERNPIQLALSSLDGPLDDINDAAGPVVIHQIVAKAEAGRSIPINAYVYSEILLEVVATFYRPAGGTKWTVSRMEAKDSGRFHTEIPASAVTATGLEYCVVAVDETLSGIGYSGMPTRPIRVAVTRSGNLWRYLGGTIGAATIGTASYLVLRRQK